jgi:hypothetical protein
LACPATGKANISRSALHTAALELHRNLASIFVDSVENDAFSVIPSLDAAERFWMERPVFCARSWSGVGLAVEGVGHGTP